MNGQDEQNHRGGFSLGFGKAWIRAYGFTSSVIVILLIGFAGVVAAQVWAGLEIVKANQRGFAMLAKDHDIAICMSSMNDHDREKLKDRYYPGIWKTICPWIRHEDYRAGD